MRIVLSAMLLASIGGAVLACGGDDPQVPNTGPGPAPGHTVHSVVVSPATLALAAGTGGLLVASIDADAGVTDRLVTWSSSDTTIATVTPLGSVRAVRGGAANITATSTADSTVKGVATVTVGSAE